MNISRWPAPGSEDTELGVFMGQEVRHGEAEVHARVQAWGCAPDHGARRVVCPGRARPGCASVAAAGLGEAVCGRSATCLPRPRTNEAGTAGDRAAQARGHQAESRTRHPKKSRGLLREGIDVKFGFIVKHRGIWPAGWLCEALGVSRGGFYAWLTRPRSKRSRSDEELGAKVRASFVGSDRTYGARRVWHDLAAEGMSCGL